MSRTISANSTVTVTLSSLADNPVLVTANITPTSGNALYGVGGGSNSWTITNSGTIKATSATSSGILLGKASAHITNASITNTGGGIISAAGDGIYAFGPATVVNAASSTISGGFRGVDITGAQTVTNSGVILGGNANFNTDGIYLGSTGVITNTVNGTISGYDGIVVNGNGAGTITNAGTIIGHTGGSGGAVRFNASYAGNRLIADPGAVFNGGIYGGTGVLELASAATAGTLSPVHIQNFSTIQFDTGAQWLLGGSYSDLGGSTFTGAAHGDTIDITNFIATGSSFSGGVLTLTNASTSATLNFQGAFTQSDFTIASDGHTGTNITLCFCRGTRIATPDGEVPVEHLSVGDLVLTQSGQAQAIKWVGTGRHIIQRGVRCAATPVIVRKGAFADNIPNRDLRVTKGHSFLLDGVLIPVEFLVNHRSILWDDHAQGVEFYHLELATHDVLLANGAPAETYRDDGNRRLFQNINAGWQDDPQPPCAPVLTGGPVVDAVWRRLLDRSGPCSLPLTDHADLHLRVDGRRLNAIAQNGAAHFFKLPNQWSEVRIVSRAASPQELGLARDPRCLGVALRRIVVRRGACLATIDASDPRLAEGFHGYEEAEGFRWTSGDAVVPEDLLATWKGAVELELNIACQAQYLAEGEQSLVA